MSPEKFSRYFMLMVASVPAMLSALEPVLPRATFLDSSVVVLAPQPPRDYIYVYTCPDDAKG
jgi:hypothetical protein